MAKPQGVEAAARARKLAQASQPCQESRVGAQGGDYEGEMETVSHHLLVELYRELTEERLRVEPAEKRRARRAGEKPPQAKHSASASVRGAMEAHRLDVDGGACVEEQGR